MLGAAWPVVELFGGSAFWSPLVELFEGSSFWPAAWPVVSLFDFSAGACVLCAGFMAGSDAFCAELGCAVDFESALSCAFIGALDAFGSLPWFVL